ncbi:response regulator [Sphingobacteriaceae bacterium]|nr:response regulator [Sphingobacteriaceae bacterium]
MAGKIFKIIIVDDDLDDHYLIKDAFKQLRYPFEIIAAYNGLELLEYFEAHANQGTKEYIDFIVMDINMPTMNGITALTRVKQNECLKTIPVFMLSTTREDSAYKECMKMGAVDFYTKPNNSADLKKILIDMFEKVSVISGF